ncbi:MAG: class I SAM-dependent methyltransferase [Thermoflexaceae bacterium]|nr:class I SAM-dependent methyltransferase [Thermoflexaceae bacterium]
MARLEGVAKAQFYPTPPSVVERVAALVRRAPSSHRRVARLLDPCCGAGDALRQFADALGGGGTFGVEIEQHRAAEAREVLDHLIAGSAFAVRLGHEAFSCLWLNPPYDEGGGGKRLEHSFLTTLSRALAPGGLLIYIVPQTRVAQSARFLASRYEGLRCYRFQDPEYDAFRQCVVLGRRRATQVIAADAQAQFAAWATDPLPELPSPGSTSPVYELPALPAGPVVFASQFFEPETAAAEARQRGLWSNATLVERFWPAEERPVRPLMPLRRGHLAVLIAAGFLDNALIEDGSRRVLVKGRITKVSRPIESADPDVEVERQFLRTSVVMLDLETGEFEDIQHGGELREASA